MTQNDYIFDDAANGRELARLRLLESVFDGASRAWLTAAGPLSGRHCLEVGAGAGSIAAWLDTEAGPTGKVTAVDMNTRFLGGLSPSVHVIEAEFASGLLPSASFDLVHARYVMIHNTNARGMLAAMLHALKPGGALVLEEPDFGAARVLVAPDSLKTAFERVQRAISAVFSERGMDHAFGSALPNMVQEATGELGQVGYDCAVARGGSDLAKMMQASALSLQEKYVATGCASQDDIAGYSTLATSPDSWATYYATVRVLVRKPR